MNDLVDQLPEDRHAMNIGCLCEIAKCADFMFTIEKYSSKRGLSPICFEKNGKTGFCLSLLAMACSDPRVTLTHALNIT